MSYPALGSIFHMLDNSVWLQTSRTISTVLVYNEDGTRKIIPSQLLLSGDRIETPPDMTLLSDHCERHDGNDSIVKDTPTASKLDDILCKNRRPDTLFERQTRTVKTIVGHTLVGSLCASLLSSIVLFAVDPRASEDLFDIFVVRHVNVCLPLLPLSIFLTSLVLKVACNAFISAKIELLQKNTEEMNRERFSSRERRLSVEDEFSTGTGRKSLRGRLVGMMGLQKQANNDDIPMMGSGQRQWQRFDVASVDRELSWRLIFDYFLQRIRKPSTQLENQNLIPIVNPCADVVETLGSATVLAFPDVDGILSEPLLSPKQIFLLTSEAKTSGSETKTVTNVKIIELLASEDRGALGASSFEDAAAVRNFLSQLKPLGLNCLLNTNAHDDDYSMFVERVLRERAQTRTRANHREHVRSEAYGDFVSCDTADASYQLAGVIGFSDAVASSFSRLMELQVLIQPPPSSASESEKKFPRLASYDTGTADKSRTERHVMSVVVEDSQQKLQLFSKGDVDFIMKRCKQIWDGQELRTMTDRDISLISHHCSECYQKHYRCIALSYVSLDEDRRQLLRESSQSGRCVFLECDGDAQLSLVGATDWQLDRQLTPRETYNVSRPKSQPEQTLKGMEELMENQIFIGMLILRFRPLPEITDAIDVLSEAGIRFVLFSDMPESATVAFGNQLGLWSDWNCCISLRDLPPPVLSRPPSPPGSGISARSAGRTNYSHPDSQQGPRLPHGIKAIRKHILEADDVPLRVSMFCDSSPDTMASMIEILQENGELVMCCGSTKNIHNMHLFASADVSMAVDPLPATRGRDVVSFYDSEADDRVLIDAQLAAEITSVPCALHFGRYWNILNILEIVSTSRMLLDAMRQASLFAAHVSLLLMSISLIGNCLLLPEVIHPAQVICILVVISPCLLVAIVLSGYRVARNIKAANPMRLKLDTKKGKPAIHRFIFYAVLRFLPTACVCVSAFVSMLSASLSSEMSGSQASPFQSISSIVSYRLRPLEEAEEVKFNTAVFEAQQVVNILLVIFMAFMAIGSLHRTASLLDLWRHCKYIWLAACAAAGLIQLLVTSIALSSSQEGVRPTLRNAPASVFVLASTWPLVILCVDEAVRHHDRKKFRRLQQRLTLQFETLLGQTSPK
eukprot:762829-Hanusia_phi.AAC.2